MITSILTLLGGGLGGIMRFIPEIFKLFTDKRDREHEFKMTQLQLEIDRERATNDIDRYSGQAYIAALQAQGSMSGIKWVDALNQSVRPVLTYWWMLIFTIYKISTIVLLIHTWESLPHFIQNVWTSEDAGIFSMIIGFWFVDRAFRKNNGN